VLAHGHQTNLETLFDFGCYNYAAPDGAENKSQRDSNPSDQSWRSAPARQKAGPLKIKEAGHYSGLFEQHLNFCVDALPSTRKE